MSGFSSDWLTLREPADHRARQRGLEAFLSSRDTTAALSIVDLGAGTGSNLRYLLPRLGGRQRWCLVDNDTMLIRLMPEAIRRWAEGLGYRVESIADGQHIRGKGIDAHVRLQLHDLAAESGTLDLAGVDLVTASALLDLFPHHRLQSLARQCAIASSACLFALSYDGRVEWSPAHANDGAMSERLNAHQRRDKGLGPAAGPGAAQAMIAALAARGYTVEHRAADWQLDAGDSALQRALIDGWHDALLEQDAAAQVDIDAWHAARRMLIDEQRSTLRVGHVDIVARLPDR